MTRFLRYALEHGRKIRAVFLLEGQMVQKTVEVVAYDDAAVTLRIGKKTPVTLPMADLLGCDYARGDHGED
ncbi:MAG: hypothetical protein IJ354_06070 [Clostridia bacterium]|nr:hypothetical protein [Clostridia bacterium]MBR3874672.1 hypothetical protein [Clostridia bacterium]